MAARKPTETSASALACSASAPRTAAESTTGSVFGIARIAQQPLAAAACVPLAIVSFVLAPRGPEVDMRVDEGRRQHEAGTVEHTVPVGGEARAQLGDRAAVDLHVDLRVDASRGREPGRRG